MTEDQTFIDVLLRPNIGLILYSKLIHELLVPVVDMSVSMQDCDFLRLENRVWVVTLTGSLSMQPALACCAGLLLRVPTPFNFELKYTLLIST
jgi:hypothetical protein